MSKQDRQGVRTATDVERKYNLGKMSEYMLTTNEKLRNIEDILLSMKDHTGGGAALLDCTVTFLVDGEVYEIASVKSGNSVSAPLTNPTSDSGTFSAWQDGNGDGVTFPYSPTEDVELIAVFSNLSEKLYSHFGISEEEYPYVAVGVLYSSGKTRVYFSQNPLNNTTSVPYKHITVNSTSGLEGVTDAETVVDWVMNHFSAPFSFNNANYTTVAGTYFANYEIENTDTVTCYPL